MVPNTALDTALDTASNGALNTVITVGKQHLPIVRTDV